jgi:hypothetical protein
MSSPQFSVDSTRVDMPESHQDVYCPADVTKAEASDFARERCSRRAEYIAWQRKRDSLTVVHQVTQGNPINGGTTNNSFIDRIFLWCSQALRDFHLKPNYFSRILCYNISSSLLSRVEASATPGRPSNPEGSPQSKLQLRAIRLIQLSFHLL